MEITKSGWVYWVAFGWWIQKPDTTNLCQLCRSFILGLFIWPMAGAIIAILSPFAFAMGNRFAVLKGDPDDRMFIPIKNYPKIGERRVLLAPVLAMGIVLWIGYEFVRLLVQSIKWIVGSDHPYRAHPYVLISLVIAGVVIYSLLRFLRSEAWVLCKAYLRAKKDQVCPTVVCR